MFGTLSRFAGDAIKGAKLATEQLAQAAQQKTDRPAPVSKSSSPQKWSQSAFPAGVQRPDVSPLSANLSSGIQLPPGLEDLSDKERQRILSVMACAQLENLNDDYIVHASSKSYSPSTVSTSMDASAVESVKRKSSLSMATTNQTTLSEYAIENVATDKVPVTGNIVGPFSKNQAASLDGDVRLAEINPTTAPEETIKLIPTNQTSSSEGAIAAVAANKADLPVDTIKAFVTNNVSSSNDNVKPDITNQKTTFSKDSVKFQTPVDESLNVNATLSPDPSVSNVYSSTVIIEDNQQVEANVTASYPERLVSDTVPTPVQKRSPQIPFEDAIQAGSAAALEERKVCSDNQTDDFSSSQSYSELPEQGISNTDELTEQSADGSFVLQHCSSSSSTFPEIPFVQEDSGYTTVASGSYEHELDTLSDSVVSSSASTSYTCGAGSTAFPVPHAPDSSYHSQTLDSSNDEFDYVYGNDRYYFDERQHTASDTKHPEDKLIISLGDNSFEESCLAKPEWSEQRPRMWTTVFVDDDSMKIDDKDNGTGIEELDDEEMSTLQEDVRECTETVKEFPTNQKSDSTQDSKDEYTQDEKRLAGSQVEKEYSVASSSMPRTKSSSSSLAESVQLAVTNSQSVANVHSTVDQIVRSAPSTTVTLPNDRGITSDEDSDVETSPSSDEDDYPDQVIEAPTMTPEVMIDEAEREVKRQESFRRDVLKQIQAFGESANDEFDVRWAHSTIDENSLKSDIFSLDHSTTPAQSFSDDGSNKFGDAQPEMEPLDVTTVTEGTSSHNPFLDIDEDDDDSLRISEEMTVDAEDTDFSTVISHYNSQQFFSHRPGPVYTIPEGDEHDDGQISSDSKYQAKEMTHRASTTRIPTVPPTPLIISHTTCAPTSVSKLRPLFRQNSSQKKGRDITTTVYSDEYFERKFQKGNSAVQVPSSLESQTLAVTADPMLSPTPSAKTCRPTTVMPVLPTNVVSALPTNISSSHGIPHVGCTALQLATCSSSAITSSTDVFEPVSTSHTSAAPKTPIRSAPPPPESIDLVSPCPVSESLPDHSSATPQVPNGVCDKSRFNGTSSSTVHSSVIPTSSLDSIGRVSAQVRPLTNLHQPSTTNSSSCIVADSRNTEASSAAFFDTLNAPRDHVFPARDNPVISTVQPETGSSVMRLKRSPAMILASGEQKGYETSVYSSSALPISHNMFSVSSSSMVTQMTRPTHKLIEEDDGLTPNVSTAADIGRRKLPSIPTQKCERTSGTISLESVYTTSKTSVLAPSSKSFECQDTIATFSPRHVSDSTSCRAYCGLASSSQTEILDLSHPSSSSNNFIDRFRTYHTMSNPKVTDGFTTGCLRQTSVTTRGRHSNLSAASTSKIPSTLARVLLKKELKAVLERRRELLEACEIEANQRQYVMHQMLVTGLLPEVRPPDIPNVIPCLLPIELVSGAKVTPSDKIIATTATLAKPLISPKSGHSDQQKDQPPTLDENLKRKECGVQLFTELPVHTQDKASSSLKDGELGNGEEEDRDTRTRSVGVQVETHFISLFTSTGSSLSLHMPSTSLRLQMEHDKANSEGERVLSCDDLLSDGQVKCRSIETQTNGALSGLSSQQMQRNKLFTGFAADGGSRHQQQKTSTSTSTTHGTSEPNLLESTAQYFAEYDRQLRERGRRMKDRFAFTDDGPASRESKKMKLKDEFAQRKEKISSMFDLSSEYAFATIHPSSDYSSVVPHYGSLPRIDYPSLTVRPCSRDFTCQNRSEHPYMCCASLPRNYGRNVDAYDVDRVTDPRYPPSVVPAIHHQRPFRSMCDLSNAATNDGTNSKCRCLESTCCLEHGLEQQSKRFTPVCYPSPMKCGRHFTNDLYAAPEYSDHVNPYLGEDFQRFRRIRSENVLSHCADSLNRRRSSDKRQQNSMSAPQDYYQPENLSLTSYPSRVGYRNMDGMTSPDELYSKYNVNRLFRNEDNSFGEKETPSLFYWSKLMSQRRAPSLLADPLYSTPTVASCAYPYQHLAFPSTSRRHSLAHYPHHSQSLLGQVYSRNEADYGAHSLPALGNYGNCERNHFDDNSLIPKCPQMPVYEMPYYSSRSSCTVPYPDVVPSYYSARNQSCANKQHALHFPRYNTTYPLTIPSYAQNSLTARVPRLSSAYHENCSNDFLLNTNLNDVPYSKMGVFNDRYDHSARWSRPSPLATKLDTHARTSTFGRKEARKRHRNTHLAQDSSSFRACDESDIYCGQHPPDPHRSSKSIKRILLMRRFQDTNFYNDLGIRVTGGRRIEGGELAAFVTAVNRGKAHETLGQIREGDRVLEWNGVLLTGKTFEEVEQIIAASKGEIEVIISSGDCEKLDCADSKQTVNNTCNQFMSEQMKSDWKHDNTNMFLKEAPPVPAHRSHMEYHPSPATRYNTSVAPCDLSSGSF